MTININVPELRELKPRILVLGVGGAGGNAINGMIEAGLQGVEFVAVNFFESTNNLFAKINILLFKVFRFRLYDFQAILDFWRPTW